MSGLSCFLFYPADWLDGVRDLTPEQNGAYINLLCGMYKGGGRVKDDSRVCCRLTGIAPQKWPRIRRELLALGKLTVPEDGFLSNGRVIREIMKQTERAESRREANSRGGMTTAMRRAEAQTQAVTPPVTPPVTPRVAVDNPLKDHDTGAVDSELKTQDSERETPVQTPEPNEDRTNTHTPRARADARERVEVPEGFDQFWEGYPPTDGGYTPALAAYREATDGGAEPDDILAGLKGYAFRSGRYVPHPARWLREQRWRSVRVVPEPELSLDELRALAIAERDELLQREAA